MIPSFVRKTGQVLIALVLVISTGCGKRLETGYATPRGTSINGISTFIQTIRNGKHRVDTPAYISPFLGDSHDCVILFAKDPGQPDQELLETFQWLIRGARVRTILWVLNNGDATSTYWEELLAGNRLSEKQKEEARRELEANNARNANHLLRTFSLTKDGLYGLENPGRKRVEKLTTVTISENPRREVKALWPLQRRLLPKSRADVLWKAGEEPLLVEDFYQNTRVLFLSSGTPLLNASLVDPGNQILAEELIQLIGEDLNQQIGPNHRIAVITNPKLRVKDDADEEKGMLHFLKVQPFPWIIGQMVLAMLLFCWWKFPIFGRPLLATHRELQQFSRHVEALGELLWRTQGNTFVLSRIREWQRVRKTQGKKVKEN